MADPRTDPLRRGRVVVVIGASSGIGRATAQALARRGDRLVLAACSPVALAEAAAECRALAPRGRGRSRRSGVRSGGASVLAVATDVADRASVDALFVAARARHGRIDAVVHTAAVVAHGRFEDVPADVFDQVIAVNVIGTANVARAALRSFAPTAGGTSCCSARSWARPRPPG